MVSRSRFAVATIGVLLIATFLTTRCGVGERDENWTAELTWSGRDQNTHISIEQFSSAEVCRACHTQYYEEWASSAMAHSVDYGEFLIDLFRVGLDVRGAPSEDVDQCLECHAPLALIGDAYDRDLTNPIVREGVTCDVCHTISEVHANDSPGDIVWDPSGPKRGPLSGSLDPPPDGEVTAAISPFHETQEMPTIESSEMCGACHMSVWPTNGLPIDWTYPEWRESAWAERGVTCQDCHMETYTGQAAPGAPVRDTLHRHNFPGRDDLEMVRSTASLDIDLDTVSDPIVLTVTVENRAAGHAFPTGNATAPSVVLEVYFLDHNGDTIQSETRHYRLQYVDSNGNVTSDPTSAAALLSNTTLLPFQPQTERFTIPRSPELAATKARLVYHPWNDQTSHRELILEFTGRYLRNGFRLERVLKNMGALLGTTTPPRGTEPIEVTSIDLPIQVLE